ncbi:hypothetical protein ACSBR2_000910 [Camellia fascicularis]
MQGIDVESKDEALKSQVAIRCARAAMLLSSLKCSPNRRLDSPNDLEHKVPLSVCAFMCILVTLNLNYFVSGKGDDAEERFRGSEEETGGGESEESTAETLQRDGVASADGDFDVSLDSLFNHRLQIPLKSFTSSSSISIFI